MSSVTKKFQLIEVVNPGVAGAGNTAVRFQFPDQPYLRNKPLFGLEFFCGGDITTTPSGNTPTTLAQMKLGYLTLYLSDPDRPADLGEWVQLVPLSRLHNIQNAAADTFSRMPFNLVGQVIQWEKCYITLATAYANTANVSFLFGAYFAEQK